MCATWLRSRLISVATSVPAEVEVGTTLGRRHGRMYAPDYSRFKVAMGMGTQKTPRSGAASHSVLAGRKYETGRQMILKRAVRRAHSSSAGSEG